MANIELKAYRKLLLNFLYYNFLFGYTLTETMWLNRAGASAHGELTNVAMMQLCSSTEIITCVGLMLSVHGKKECTRYFSEIYRWNVSSNVTKVGYTALLQQPNQGGRELREALHSCRTPSVWKVHWPGLSLWSAVKELIWFTISLSFNFHLINSSCSAAVDRVRNSSGKLILPLLRQEDPPVVLAQGLTANVGRLTAIDFGSSFNTNRVTPSLIKRL